MSELDVDGELIGNTDLVESNRNILESINSCVLSSKRGIQKQFERSQTKKGFNSRKIRKQCWSQKTNNYFN